MPAKKTAKEKPEKKIGRPKKEIDAKLVEHLASIGCTLSEIAAACECHHDTLLNRFSEELNKGREDGKTRLRKKQIEIALDGNVTMLIWLGKQILGQADKLESKTEHSGEINSRTERDEKDMEDFALKLAKAHKKLGNK